MICFDASYLVRLYDQDPGAAAVRALATTNHLACAAHRQAEIGRRLPSQAARERDKACLLCCVAWSGGSAHSGRSLPLNSTEQRDSVPNAECLRETAGECVSAPGRCAPSGDGGRVGVPRGVPEVYSNDLHLLAATKHFGLVGKNVI